MKPENKTPHNNAPYKVAALYQFTPIKNIQNRQQQTLKLCLKEGLKGTILIAHEGLNGTIAGTDDAIDRLIDHLKSWPEINNLDVKYSRSKSPGFLRMKVRIKKEIVTMGKPNINPTTQAGTHIDPKDWNALISRPDVLLIDTRNTYETRIGAFKNAVCPQTRTFRAFPQWADALKDSLNPPQAIAPRAIAMYCTGGIRCEKASAYMKQIGFNEVYHLKGGILKYLEDIPEEDSLWDGECFVFDERIALKHGLAQGSYDTCFACKDPISQNDKTQPQFEEGVSCHRCINTYSEAQKEKFRNRQKQIQIANKRGQKHLGQNTQASKRNR